MNKINLIWIIALLLLVPTVNADWDLTPNNLMASTLDEGDYNANLIYDVYDGSHNGTNDGATSNQASLLGTSFSFDGTDDEITYSTITPSGDHTIAGWYYADDTTTRVIYSSTVTSTSGIFFRLTNEGYDVYSNEGYICDGVGSITTAVWTHWILSFTDSSDNWDLYINNISVCSGANGQPTFNTHAKFGEKDGSNWFKGKLDELGYWTHVLNATDRANLYNSSYGISMNDLNEETPPPPSATSNFTMTANNTGTGTAISNFEATINGTHYETTISQINTTILTTTPHLFDINASAYGFYNLSLTDINVSTNWQLNFTPILVGAIKSIYPKNNTQFSALPTMYVIANITYNNTNISVWIENEGIVSTQLVNAGDNQNISLGAPPVRADGTYVWQVNLTKPSITGSENSSITQLFYIDTQDPTIVTTFVNNSLYFFDNITAQFNFTDDISLFSFNISIDGSTIVNKSDILSTSYQYNLSYDPTSLSINSHTLTAILADGHTKNFIEKMSVSNGLFNDYLRYGWAGSWVKIKNKDGSIFDSFFSEKKIDKYEWIFEPDELKNKYTFTITASEYINIMERPDTIYKKWLIVDDRWMDFMIEGEAPTISIERISNNEVEVTLDNIIKPEKQKFKSIGELNIITETFSFVVGNATLTFDDVVTETSNQVYTLNLSRDIFTSSEATFVFNGISRSVSKTTNTNYDEYSSPLQLPLIASLTENQTGTWSINISGNTTMNLDVNMTQRLVAMNISNCSGSITDRAINYSLREENFATLVNGNITASYILWKDNSSLTRTYSFFSENVNRTNICIYTNDTLSITHTINYIAPAYNTNNRVIHGLINKTTELINLFLATTTDDVVVNIIDRSSNVLVGYYLELYKYSNFVASYVLLESGLSDFAGNILFNYEPTSKYRIIVYNTTLDQVYDTTATGMYFVSNPTTIRIASEIDFSDLETGIYNATSNATWTNYTSDNSSLASFMNEIKDDIHPFYRVVIALIVSLILGATFFVWLGALGATAIAYAVFVGFATTGFISWIFPIILSLLIFAGYITLGGNEGT